MCTAPLSPNPEPETSIESPAGNERPWTGRWKCEKLHSGTDEGCVMRRLVLGLVLAGFTVLPSLVIIEPTAATVPGENGRLAYADR